MSTESVIATLKTLRRCHLLKQRRLRELNEHAQDFATSRDLVRNLVQRGWLTPYQANQLAQGNAPGLVLGSYVLLERLGAGGMGQVFRARHANLDRIVALKVVHQRLVSSAEILRRFRREIRAVSQLAHPNVVRAFDADQVGNVHFFVMEYVEGIDLSQRVKTCGPMSVRDACDAIRQAALGLQHAHEHGLVHRDIKPSNLLLSHAQGLQPLGVVKLLDLGVARLREVEGETSGSLDLQAPGSFASSLTETGRVIGTPDYIAPEQAVNPRGVDCRADLYSLGCTFYFLLTGRVPFPGGSLLDKLCRHQSARPVPIERFRSEVPPAVVGVVRKLMAKRPAERYQTPGELAAALETLGRAPPAHSARPTTLAGDVERSVRVTVAEHDVVRRFGSGRRSILLLMLAVLVLLLSRVAYLTLLR